MVWGVLLFCLIIKNYIDNIYLLINTIRYVLRLHNQSPQEHPNILHD